MCHSIEQAAGRALRAPKRAPKSSQRALITCAHLVCALVCLLAMRSSAFADPKAPKEPKEPLSRPQTPQLTLRPTSAERPSELVGVWEGAGVRLTLSQSGTAEVSERAEAHTQAAKTWRLVERTRWWVEGAQLCLLAGLERACEPYQLSHNEASGLTSLTLRGRSLIKRP